jgi:glycerophosphoryl diester phosphodiesterase
MSGPPIVIAHRGASGYLPEHTLAAKALAHGMGADYLEQDVVATRDGRLLVFHDLSLDAMTDVAERFPGRSRPDGHFYCIDFTLAEIRTLAVRERRRMPEGRMRYPGRFPDGAGTFSIATLEEEIAFIQGLNRSTGRTAGLYPEIKHPAWHREHGVDLGARLLEVLRDFGYADAADPVYVQCFDPGELQRLRRELGCRLRLIQLLEGTDSGGRIPGPPELAAISAYANGIGPALSLICLGREGDGPSLSSLVEDAHRVGLLVHPYTVRADDLPAGLPSVDVLLALVLGHLHADGVFTDFPDHVRRFVAAELRWPLPRA